MIKERLIKFSNILQEHQLDAVFIVNKANIRYLSGYTGDDAYLFITPKRRALITDSRYTEQAGRECAEYEVITHHNPEASLMKIIKQLCVEAQVKQLAFERNHLSYLLFEKLQQAFEVSELPEVVAEQVEIFAKYEGYINKQKQEVEKAILQQ